MVEYRNPMTQWLAQHLLDCWHELREQSDNDEQQAMINGYTSMQALSTMVPAVFDELVSSMTRIGFIPIDEEGVRELTLGDFAFSAGVAFAVQYPELAHALRAENDIGGNGVVAAFGASAADALHCLYTLLEAEHEHE